MNRASIATVLCSFALAASPGLYAADAATQGNTLKLGGSGSGSGKLLTRDQLRQCLSQQAALKTQGAEALRGREAIDAAKTELARLEAELAALAGELQAERASVDVSKTEAVEAFNARLALHEQKRRHREREVEAYNARLPAYNAQAEAHNAGQQAWQTECADRSYNEADFFAIQRGK